MRIVNVATRRDGSPLPGRLGAGAPTLWVRAPEEGVVAETEGWAPLPEFRIQWVRGGA